ncbi:hypothetical protein AX14_008683 [Amanita brunnescens Koide BX004]|nr:hypothetical protein AX14_009196 [Amanita brunnescens Koide BX004]KAF8724700.1 hypothetical protein AX14_008683 [Amanita brunnescens Koide BX004]
MHLAVPVSIILLLNASLSAVALPHGGNADSFVAPRAPAAFPEIQERSPLFEFDLIKGVAHLAEHFIKGQVQNHIQNNQNQHRRDLYDQAQDPQDVQEERALLLKLRKKLIHYRQEVDRRLSELNKRDLDTELD